MLNTLLDRVRLIVEHSLEIHAAEQSRREWEHTATHDPLTGLLNRHVLEFLPVPDPGTGVIMIDIDHFKAVNDTWGHPVGDQVLAGVAAAIESAVRSADQVIRYGGEEMLVLVKCDEKPEIPGGASPDHLDALAERIRASVETLDLEPIAAGLAVTISLGVASTTPGDTWASAVEQADRALYRAKESGRNRVERADVVNNDIPITSR